VEEKKMFKIGDEVKLIPGAVFTSGKEIKAGWFNTKLYVRDINDENITIASVKNGPVIGVVSNWMLVNYTDDTYVNINSYAVIVNEKTDIYNGAGKNNRIIGKANKYNLYTIIQEQNGWGKLQKGSGWIELEKVEKLA
jgi:hypothetical protein